MNKRITQKLFTALAIVVLSLGSAFAQVDNADYTSYSSNLLTPTGVDFVTLNTGGTVMGFYAEPDGTYHPNYNAGGGWALTSGFTWDWQIPVNPGAGASITTPAAGPYSNNVRVTFTAANTYRLSTAETAPASFGGCADASPTIINVEVIAPPTGSITTADPAQACGDVAASTFTMRITEALNDSIASYAFSIAETVDNLNPDSSLSANVSTNAAYANYLTSGKVNSTTTGAPLSAAWTTSGNNRDLVFNTSAFTVQNGMRTRYRYTLSKASDAPGAAAAGIISAISEKSDYINATVRTHSFTGDIEFVVIVNPQPETGPIFHIRNQYAY